MVSTASVRNTPVSEILKIYDQQRALFNAGKTRSYKSRVAALKQLRRVIREYEAEILEALRLDLGRPVFEAYSADIGLVYKEINKTLAHLKQWMQPKSVPTTIEMFPSASQIQMEPLGVVLIIAPWNYPFQLAMAPLIAAIAAGNCAIVKPSEISAHSANVIEKVIEAAFPDGSAAVVLGDGATVVPTLLDNSNLNHIFFTGSTRVGRIIAKSAAEQLIPVTLELGGKSPVLVDHKCDLKMAAKRIVWGKFFNAGQTCIAPDYVLLPENQLEPFIEYSKNFIRKFYGHRPIESPDYARIISQTHFERLNYYLTEGNIIYGGDTDISKKYIGPTLLGGVSMNDKVMQEEIFGPILPVLTYQNLAGALDIIRKNPQPLAFYLFSKSRTTRKLVMNNVSFGGGITNHTLMHFANTELPFGGVGNSGMGRYHARYGFETFSNKKSVMKFNTWIDIPLIYPPFRSWQTRILKWLLR